MNIRPLLKGSELLSFTFVILLECVFSGFVFGNVPKLPAHLVGFELWLEWLGYWYYWMVCYAGLLVFDILKALLLLDKF